MSSLVEEISDITEVEKIILEILPTFIEQNKGDIVRLTNHSVRYHARRTRNVDLTSSAVRTVLAHMAQNREGHQPKLVRVNGRNASKGNVQYLFAFCADKVNIIRK